ncbi:1-acyl-sn-glycerol-3-phosphate acyltransferase [Muribaculaceae bacterium Isolate-013 (NCI)]|nr:1-acyl-sn-glycerol-3-phosphate acyltransferase [Muribaculaceae bacterium Isolate-013 (NCI)]
MLILYRIYQFVIMIPMIVALTIVTGLITVVGSLLGGGRFWGYWPAHVWAKLCTWLTLVRVTVSGRGNIDPHTSYVFVANHQGAYDIFAVYGFLNHNFKWLMKAGLRKFPVIGVACAAAGHVFVDNSSPSAIRRTMAKAERTLQGGMSVVVFPEGSRTRTGRMRPFHKGAYQLSMEFGLPVVPVTIDGAFDVLPRGSWLPRPGRIKLTIHPPVDPPVDEADRRRVIDASYEAVHSALPPRHQ